MKNKVLISAHSEKGLRERNEDYFVTCSNDFNQTLAVVCDGIGGDDDSQIASRLLASLFEETFLKRKCIKNFSSFYNKVLISATKQINKRSTFNRIMGTTVCVVLVSENYVEMANMGDSRIYFHKYGSSI
jgi:serine/threonine protein phosphatase PrpC